MNKTSVLVSGMFALVFTVLTLLANAFVLVGVIENGVLSNTGIWLGIAGVFLFWFSVCLFISYE